MIMAVVIALFFGLLEFLADVIAKFDNVLSIIYFDG